MANRIVITGRLVADPELRTTQSGISTTGFRIAVQRRYSKEDIADFFDVEAWRATAEFVCKHFVKGKLIEIDGCLQTSPWEDKNKSKHQGVKIVAEQVSFVGNKLKEQSGSNQRTVSPDLGQGFDPFSTSDDSGDMPF